MKTVSNSTYEQIKRTLKAVSSMVVDARLLKEVNAIRNAKRLIKKLK